MSSQSLGYTRHVRRLPCKDVPVLTDELDERAFLFGIQVSTDADRLDESTGTKSTILVSVADLNFNAGSCSVLGFFKEVMSVGSTLSL